jgi:regulator of protease activity HflC (stomatin/prohibitin superfamily)
MTYEEQQRENAKLAWRISITVTALLLFLVAVGMVGCPQYRVYSQRLEGQALLAHAQSSKEVAVAEAKAKMESASLLAQAEVARAEGVAKANKIIGDSLKDNDAYLRYLWVTEVAGKDIDKTVVYVPTEANVPILEAGRFIPPK